MRTMGVSVDGVTELLWDEHRRSNRKLCGCDGTTGSALWLGLLHARGLERVIGNEDPAAETMWSCQACLNQKSLATMFEVPCSPTLSDPSQSDSAASPTKSRQRPTPLSIPIWPYWAPIMPRGPVALILHGVP